MVKVWELIKKYAKENPRDEFVIYDQEGKEVATIRWRGTYRGGMELFEVYPPLGSARFQIIPLWIAPPEAQEEAFAETWVAEMTDLSANIEYRTEHLFDVDRQLRELMSESGERDIERKWKTLEYLTRATTDFYEKMARHYATRLFAYSEIRKWLNLELEE